MENEWVSTDASLCQSFFMDSRDFSMFFLRKPSELKVNSLLELWKQQPFNYSEQGTTRDGNIPAGYSINHAKVILGQGEDVFLSAQLALSHWRQFELSWSQICWPSTSITPGECVAVLARTMGSWALSPCRIVSVIEEANRVGFIYGTVQGHPMKGEERFLVEHNSVTNEVSYEILSFSKPVQFLARMGVFYIRRVQKRFARDSTAAMLNAVSISTQDASE